MDVPYLIQRVIHRDTPKENKKGIDKHFSFDYMGSAEFEFGTLPKTMKEFRAIPKQKLKVHEIVFAPERGKVMKAYVVGEEDQVKVALAITMDQVTNERKFRFKEPTYMYASFTGKDSMFPDREASHSLRCDGWWALTDKPFIIFQKREHAELWLNCI